MASVAEQHLLREFVEGAELLKRDLHYNPTYFLGMVGDYGPVEASKRLIGSKDPSDGFTKLWEAGKLDMTVEAIALLPWYEELFGDSDRAAARRRLEAYGFDVDGFLARRTASPPSWWHG